MKETFANFHNSPQLSHVLNKSSNFGDVSDLIVDLFNTIIAFLVTLIVVYFIWTIIQTWIIGGGDPSEVERGKQKFMVGFIVLICVIGLWGIVAMVRTTFGF